MAFINNEHIQSSQPLQSQSLQQSSQQQSYYTSMASSTPLIPQPYIQQSQQQQHYQYVPPHMQEQLPPQYQQYPPHPPQQQHPTSNLMQQPLLQNEVMYSTPSPQVTITVNNNQPIPIPEYSSDKLRQHLLLPFNGNTTNATGSAYTAPAYTHIPKTEVISGSSSEYRDKFWAILYLAHFFTYNIGGIYLFFQQFHSLDDFDFNVTTLTYQIIGIIAGISITLSFLALLLAKYHPVFMIYTAIYCGFIFYIAIFIISLMYGIWGTAVLAGVLGLFYAIWFLCVRKRIPFVVAMLRQASEVVSRWPTTLIIAIAAIILEIVVICLWIVSSVGIFAAANSNHTDSWDITNRGYASIIAIVLSMFWTTQVVKNILHCTISGLTSYWYFLYPTSQSPNPTLHSLKRASTTSFGSICLGSLVLAIVRTLRVIASMFGGDGSGSKSCISLLLWCCARIILYIVDAIVTYVNVYAFVQVSVYGKSYCTAAKDALSLLQKRGFDAIVNDSLIGTLLTFTSLLCGLIGGIAVSGFAYLMHNDGYIPWGVVSGIFCFAITLMAMEVLDSAIVTIFVCLAEDPTSLYQTKPESYKKLVDALAIGYPKVAAKKAIRKKQQKKNRNVVTQPPTQTIATAPTTAQSVNLNAIPNPSVQSL